MFLYNNYLFFTKNFICLSVPKFSLGLFYSNNLLIFYTYNFFLRELLLFLRDSTSLLYKLLVDLVCSDFIGRKYRFEITYILLSVTYSSRLFVRLNTNSFDSVYSVTSIYNNANWYEREVWDLFGIFFYYNNDLRRILTDYGFKGFPFRKDFPISGYYEFYYDLLLSKVSCKPVSFFSSFKLFNYSLGYSSNSSFLENVSLLYTSGFYFRLVFFNILDSFLCCD